MMTRPTPSGRFEAETTTSASMRAAGMSLQSGTQHFDLQFVELRNFAHHFKIIPPRLISHQVITAHIFECVRKSQIETIVVDNKSHDNSMSLVENQFPGFKTIYNSQNLGFAEGNNVGIRKSNGEFVVLVNNDLFLDRDAISFVHAPNNS